MKTKLLIGIFVLCVSQAFAQGTWDRATANWSYDFTGPQSNPLPVLTSSATGKPTTSAGIFVTSTSLTTVPTDNGFGELAPYASFADTVGGPNGKLSWIPRPTDASAFVRLPGLQNTYHNIITDPITNVKSMKVSVQGAGSNKFSLYGIAAASPVAKYSFKLKLSATTLTHTGGVVRLVFGNGAWGSAGVFTSGSNIAAATDTRVFAGFEWLFTTNTDVASTTYNPEGNLLFRYRKKSGSGNAIYTIIPDNNFVFQKNGEYDMQFFMNNYASSQTYTHKILVGGVLKDSTFTISSKATHIWANGSRVGEEIIANISTTNELPVGSTINAVMFNHNSLLAVETAAFEVSNIAASYITQAALPITLSSFTAKKANNAVNLNWTTSSETNNSHFDIMRSTNGTDFNVLGNIKGAGNSNKVENYLYTDYSPVIGTNYYKLRQVDYDAAYTDSDVRAVTIGLQESGLWVFSDVSGSLYALINSEAASANGTLRISDIAGRVVFEQNVKLESGSRKISLPVSLPGIYVASFISEGKVYSTKFVK